MNFKGYTFPHPILGLGDNVEGEVKLEITLDDKKDTNNYLLNVQCQIDNKDILNLISNNKAKLYCETNCSSTLFRNAVLSSTLDHTILIPKDHVRERVELLILILAAENIKDYTNTNSHKEFEGYTFEIEEGDVLAYIGESYFIAGIAYNKLKAASSFMEVVRGENIEGDYNIILDNPKIQIQLSHKDYDKYVDPSIGKNVGYKNIIHSSIVLSSLIYAINQLLTSQDKDDFLRKSWAKIIQFRMESDPALNSISFEQENVCKIAQVLLGMPIDRLMTDLFNLSHPTTEDD
jgi:hypothetical protein